MFGGQVLSYPPYLMEPAHLDLEKQAESNSSHFVMRLNGKLALETVHDFIQTLRPEPAAHLVLDLGGVSFLDSAGVGALVQLFVHRRIQGQSFSLTGLTKQSSAVIQVAGLSKLLPIHGSVEEALAQRA
jgi:anti-anti-sigma factor